MKRFTVFAAYAMAASLAAAQPPAKDRHVIVFSIDGLPAYALDDPRLPIPTIRAMAAKGAVARGVRIINPTVTWPNHTAMVTGVNASVHHLLFNGLLTRGTPTAAPKVEPWRDKSEMVHAPTVYDIAYRAGLTTAQVDWVAITNPGTITWEFPERPSLQGKVEREMIAAGEVTEDEIAGFFKSNTPWRDQVWTQAAAFITRRHKPNLGLYHLLNLDSTNHTYGPRTLASLTAMALADAKVKEIVEAAKAAGIYDKTTFLIVSDHGFKTVKKVIRANVAVKQAGIQGVTAIPEGGTALVYIHDAAQRKELTPKLAALFGAVEGVQRVYVPAEYGELGLPTPERSSQGPDLVLAARNTYGFGGGSEGPAVTDQMQGGSHGYVATDPEMNSVFVACGRGIKKGVKLDTIGIVDFAPTIARLLGLRMENIAGKAPAAAFE